MLFYNVFYNLNKLILKNKKNILNIFEKQYIFNFFNKLIN